MIPSSKEIRSIYASIDARQGLKVDTQGWNSENPIFDRLIGNIHPDVIVEVGVWKGASLIHMANICRARGWGTVLYGVDAWVNSVGFMIGNPPESQIPVDWQEPTMYEQFLFNVKMSGHEERIIPVWNFTRWAADCLRHWGVVADLLYIDAAHDEDAVLDDLRRYWEILRPGGIMFGDDYSPTYCGVPQALQRFCKEKGRTFQVEGCQWFLDPK
jgi:predicted O-methyltransferase YrrM